jgi:putative DNA primase/helicase
MSGDIDFKGINRTALGRAPSFLQELIPGGKVRKAEYVVRNPGRNDKKLGSFTINHKTGQWADFADNDSAARGGDVISWFAYALKLDQTEAARQIAEKLGVPLYESDRSGVSAAARSGSASQSGSHLWLWDEEGPPKDQAEIRRHYYPSSSFPRKKVKIKLKSEPKARWVSYFRVFKNETAVGWQAKKSDDYIAIPYVSTALDPFDPELEADEVLWPEGEKDVDTLSGLNLPAFTFGGVGDGLPDGIGHYLKGRRILILADNHEQGRTHAEDKARIAHEAGAASVRMLHFPELPSKEDVSYLIENGGTKQELEARIDAAVSWTLPARAADLPIVEVSGEGTNHQNGRQLVVRRADEIIARPIEWLWPGRIARGKLTLFGGDPGLGKSQVLLFIAATLSNRGLWPCGEGRAPLGHVIVLSAEDGEDDTIKPRLMAAGADCSKVHIVSAVREGVDRKMFSLQRDLDLLEALISTLNGPVESVIIDPITAYLGPVDSHKMAEMRAVLGPIAELAARLNVAFIGNTHLNKSTEQGNALYRFIGSIATVAAARAAFAVVEDRDDPTRRLLVHAKNNLAAAPAGLAFRLEQHVVADGIVTSAVAWESDHVDHTADSALNFPAERAPTAKDDAIDFLQNILAAGPLAVSEVEREARDYGLLGEKAQISQCKPLRMARKALGIEPKKSGMRDGWMWSLPKSSDGASPPSVVEDLEASTSSKMPLEAEGAQTKDRAPSEGEGTFGADIATHPAGGSGLNGTPSSPFHSPQQEDDLSIPDFLRRHIGGVQ